MLDSSAPLKFSAVWGVSADPGTINYPVPVPSQEGITNGAASFTTGFPPNCFIPYASGGAGPFGKDFNGVLKQATAGLQWVQAGGPWVYDNTFQSAIGGYPSGAVIMSATAPGKFWLSSTDNNVTNPDTGGAGWAVFPPPSPPGVTLRLSANVVTAGTSVTFTADYISVATALGGQSFSLANLNQTFNGATTGAGGMDTGSLPTSGFVSIYAIYNPTTNTASILGTIASQSTIYGGTHMPSGYTASALIAIWPTNSSSQLVAGTQTDRNFAYQGTGAGGTPLSNGSATSATLISLSGGVPTAARSVYGSFLLSETSSIGANSFVTFGATNGVHQIFINAQVTNTQTSIQQFVFLATAQQIFYAAGQSSVRAGMQILGYTL